MNIDQLNKEFGRKESVIFREGPGGLPVAEITNPQGEALISLNGAHIISYMPVGTEPVLWMSGVSNFEEGVPIRGGVPVCWPWFGPHSEDANKPTHGFARTSTWEVAETFEQGDEGTGIRFRLTDNEQSRALWDHAFAAEIEFIIGTVLQMKFTVKNPGETPFSCTSALHSYFNISNIDNISIEGLGSCSYIDKLDSRNPDKTQKGTITIAEEVDRIYIDTEAECRINDPGFARIITVAKSGSKSTVVWNPWIDKSKRMPDFGDEEYSTMVCIETCNAGPDSVTVQPGGQHELVAVIGIEEL